MEKIELTDEEVSSILDKINIEEKELQSKEMALMESMLGKEIRYQNLRNISILKGILSNAGKPIDDKLIGSALTLVNKSLLGREDYSVFARDFVIAEGVFNNQGTLPWDNYSYDMLMLVNLRTGYVEKKIAYTNNNKEEIIKELLKDHYVYEIKYNDK